MLLRAGAAPEELGRPPAPPAVLPAPVRERRPPAGATSIVTADSGAPPPLVLGRLLPPVLGRLLPVLLAARAASACGWP